MNKAKQYALGLLLLCAGAIPCAADEPYPSFLYSLPEDGAWVEFEFEGATLVSNVTGTLRLSSVGKKAIKDAPHRWIEIKVDAVTETRGKKKELTFVKLLVPEKAVTEGRPLKGQVAEGYAKEGWDGPVRRLEAESIDELSRLGIRGAAEARLQLVKDKEEVTTKLGKLSTRHLVFTTKNGAKVIEGADFWLSPEVPFGCLKARLRTFGLFTFTAAKKGEDAKSELDESQAAK